MTTTPRREMPAGRRCFAGVIIFRVRAFYSLSLPDLSSAALDARGKGSVV